MSEATTDILLRLRVEVTGLSAIQQLNRANEKVQLSQDRVAASAARTATAQQRLAAAEQRTTAAAAQAAAAQQRVVAAESRAQAAAASLQAAQQKLQAAQNRTGTSARQLAAAELRVQQASAKLQAAQHGVAAAESRAQGAALRASSAQQGLAAAHSRAQTAATNASAAEVRLQTALNNESAAATRAATATIRLQQAKDNLDRANQRVGKGVGYLLTKFGNFNKKLNDTERAMDAVFRAGVHLQSMGRDLLGALKKLTGFITNATDAWGEYEWWLKRAAGAAELFDESSSLFGELNDKIMEMSHTLGFFDPKTIAEGLYYWQSTTGELIESTADLDVALAGLEAGMKAAAMTGADYEQVLKGAYSISRQYQMPLKEIPDILADLFMITKNTSLEYMDLIQSFKFTGPISKMLGGSYKDMARWLGIIGDLGMRGSISGRGLGMMFTQLVRPTDKAKKAYNELFKAQMGVSDGYNKLVFKKGKFVGFEKWVTTLAKATKDLSQQEKIRYLTTITGTQNSARIVLPLVDAQMRALKQQNSIFTESKYDLATSGKVFKASWDQLSASWKGVTGRLRNTVMPMFLHLGRSVAKMLTPMLSELTDTLWDMKPAFEQVTESIVKTFQPAVDQIGKLFRKALDWFKANPKIVKQIATWGVLAVVIGGVVGAIMLAVGTLIFFLNTMVLIIIGMAPMLMMLAAVAAGFALLASKVYNNTGGIRDAIGVLVNSIISAFNRLFGGSKGLGDGLGNLWDTINKLVDKGLKKLAEWIVKVADKIDQITPQDVETLKGIAGALLAIGATWKGLNMVSDSFVALNKGLRGFKMAASGLGAIASGLAGIPAAISNLPGLLTGIGVGIRGIGTALAANPIGLAIVAIIAAITAFVVAYETNFLGFKDFVDGIVQWFVTNVGPVIAGIFQWLQEVILPILQGMADFVSNVLLPAFNELVTWLGETFGPLWEQMQATLQAFLDFIGAIPNLIGEVFAAIIVWLESLGIDWDAVWLTITTSLGTAIETLKTLISAGLAFIWAAWNGVWSFISTFLKNIIEGIVTVIKGFWQIVEGIFEVFGGIISGDWDKVWSGIEDIIRGILGVIEGLFRSAIAIFQSVIAGGLSFIDSLFKTIFGEGDGSIYWGIKGFIDTVTNFGGMIIEGFVSGVKGAIDWAITQAKTLFGNIIDAIKGFLGIKSPATIMLSIGKNIVTGLWKGINDAKDWIIGKVTSFIANVIPGPIRDALGMHSPSRVMAALGENIVMGLAVGIERTDDAARAMAAQASSIMGTMNGLQTAAVGIGGTFNASSTSDATRTINLNVDVTSGDGSVSNLDVTTLAGIITGSDMVRALEHMATVE